MKVENIFKNLNPDFNNEISEILFSEKNIRIEKIISTGQKSPEGFWYDQEETEWIIVLKGKASLKFQDGQRLNLKEGDYLSIPPHLKHRVEYTAKERETIWLAVFF
ncbi:MAG: cupin domain-containing protein [Ignavibacteriaceae bacterium]|nr:cupin domain-containing protein [Ignavibacteriaceae bacterium]